MGFEHEPGTVWKAQEMYCVDRMSFDAVALATGVAASTLKRWSERFSWRAKREEIAQAEAHLRADKMLARSVMLKELIASKNPQVGFAVAGLESIALKEAEFVRKREEAEAKRRADAESVTQDENDRRLPQLDEERMELLRAAVDRELAALLHVPAGEVLGRVEKLQKSLAWLRAQGEAPESAGGVTVGWRDEPWGHDA